MEGFLGTSVHQADIRSANKVTLTRILRHKPRGLQSWVHTRYAARKTNDSSVVGAAAKVAWKSSSPLYARSGTTRAGTLTRKESLKQRKKALAAKIRRRN